MSYADLLLVDAQESKLFHQAKQLLECLVSGSFLPINLIEFPHSPLKLSGGPRLFSARLLLG